MCKLNLQKTCQVAYKSVLDLQRLCVHGGRHQRLQRFFPARLHGATRRPPKRFLRDLTLCVSVFPGRSSGRALHVHEHRRHLHQLPVGPGSAPGLPRDTALHRGPAAAGDGEPETGERPRSDRRLTGSGVSAVSGSVWRHSDRQGLKHRVQKILANRG